MQFPDEGLAGSAKGREKSFKDGWRYQGRCGLQVLLLFQLPSDFLQPLSCFVCRFVLRRSEAVLQPTPTWEKYREGLLPAGKWLNIMEVRARSQAQRMSTRFCCDPQVPRPGFCPGHVQTCREQSPDPVQVAAGAGCLPGIPLRPLLPRAVQGVSTRAPVLQLPSCTLLSPLTAGYQHLPCHQGIAKTQSYQQTLQPVSDTFASTLYLD